MTIPQNVGFEYPTILTPPTEAGGFQGWGVRIG
jgi:hypothetical protein